MRLALFLGLIFCTPGIIAQSPEIIHLWPEDVPGENEMKHEPAVIRDAHGHAARLTDITDPMLTVHRPTGPDRKGAGIIICPGGAYKFLSIELEGYEIADWLNKLGYWAFVLQYRVPDRQEGALMDIQRAIRIVRSRAGDWELDPGRLGVLGFSAGGSLSARAGTSEETYKQVDDVDFVSCLPDFMLLIYPAYLDQGENRSLTPGISIGQQTPPAFIFGTADDFYGNSALVMTGALRDNGIPVELHLLPSGGHGYGLRPGNLAAGTWPHLAAEWLNNALNK